MRFSSNNIRNNIFRLSASKNDNGHSNQTQLQTNNGFSTRKPIFNTIHFQRKATQYYKFLLFNKNRPTDFKIQNVCRFYFNNQHTTLLQTTTAAILETWPLHSFQNNIGIANQIKQPIHNFAFANRRELFSTTQQHSTHNFMQIKKLCFKV